MKLSARAPARGGVTVEAVWIILLAGTVIAFLFLQTVLFPKLFFRVRFAALEPTGRGVRVIEEQDGRTIVYDGDLSVRKYLPQYLISERGGKKQIVCRVGEGVRYLEYDVAVHDKFNTVTDVLHVREVLSAPGYTSAVDLPEETAFVSLRLNAVDGRQFSARMTGRIPGRNLFLYAVFCLVLNILAVFSARACIANLFGGIYGEAFLYSAESVGIAFAVAVGMLLLELLLIPPVVAGRRNKKDKKL